jgi:hypothetical protein
METSDDAVQRIPATSNGTATASRNAAAPAVAVRDPCRATCVHIGSGSGSPPKRGRTFSSPTLFCNSCAASAIGADFPSSFNATAAAFDVDAAAGSCFDAGNTKAIAESEARV